MSGRKRVGKSDGGRTSFREKQFEDTVEKRQTKATYEELPPVKSNPCFFDSLMDQRGKKRKKKENKDISNNRK